MGERSPRCTVVEANKPKLTWASNLITFGSRTTIADPSFDLHELLAPHGDVSSILDRVDRQKEAVRRHIESVMGSNMRQRMLDRDADLRTPECASVPHRTCGSFDYLKNAYELGKEDQVRYKVRFKFEGYGPEDIQLNTSEHAAVVHTKALKSLSEAEVKKSETAERTLTLKLIGTVGPTIIKNETTGGEKLNVEVPIEPEITTDDLCVRMDANRVTVLSQNCAHENASPKSVHVKEFTDGGQVFGEQSAAREHVVGGDSVDACL
ncbi:uncharacterized protein DEA37_0007544 [Paragonimus westermani]|uniref:SHSP domain-containing protein n=1 Tax=Paragonimus westermani TaxID=34504 RepID=A0A5J4N4W5_9TREM|nr:uncharacterized protein DEA37_0007544 [Paragonimus westermani]